jgi:hypothetical protein
MFGVTLRLSAAIEPFFYPVLALCAVDALRLGVDLARPYRTRPCVALRLALNALWLALLVLAVFAAVSAVLVATDVVRLVRR